MRAARAPFALAGKPHAPRGTAARTPTAHECHARTRRRARKPMCKSATHASARMRVRTCACARAHARTYKHTHARARMCTRECACVCTCTHTHVRTHARTHARTHTHTHTLSLSLTHTLTGTYHARTGACSRVRVYACTQAQARSATHLRHRTSTRCRGARTCTHTRPHATRTEAGTELIILIRARACASGGPHMAATGCGGIGTRS